MKRILFCILVLGFLYGLAKSACAESYAVFSNSADIQVGATVISPVGFVSSSNPEFTPSRKISVLTSGNYLLNIDNVNGEFFLISSENSDCFTVNNNLLWSDITPLISAKSAELFGERTADSMLCLITLITISD